MARQGHPHTTRQAPTPTGGAQPSHGLRKGGGLFLPPQGA
jgi:hypothetical protein